MYVVGLDRGRCVGSIAFGPGGATGGSGGFVLVLWILNGESKLVEGVDIAPLDYGVEACDKRREISWRT
jgi:hypothetical protein